MHPETLGPGFRITENLLAAAPCRGSGLCCTEQAAHASDLKTFEAGELQYDRVSNDECSFHGYVHIT